MRDAPSFAATFMTPHQQQHKSFPPAAEHNKRPAAAADSPHNSSKRPRTEAGWNSDLHRSLVEAIFDVGLKQASPSIILEYMTQADDLVTSERVKSHLQKYRNNKDKSQAEFMAEYDSWMRRAMTVGAAGGSRTIAEMVAGSAKLLGGDAAAYLSYSTIMEGEDREAAATSGFDGAKVLTGARIPFPELTEEERRTPLGMSIGHVIALFYSMSQTLLKRREENGMKGAPTVPPLPMEGPISHPLFSPNAELHAEVARGNNPGDTPAHALMRHLRPLDQAMAQVDVTQVAAMHDSAKYPAMNHADYRAAKPPPSRRLGEM